MVKRKASRNQDASKRLKINPNDEPEVDVSKCPIADALFGCTDVVSVMFSFLDVRQLLRFVCVSKEFKNLLTYDHVIRTTMLTGGFPLTNLERMVPPIRRRNIWIPSPLRLLRTVCGKRCERCNEKNRFVCDSFGVFLCKKCLNKSTKLFRRSKQWKDYLEAPRISLGPRKGTTGQSHNYLMLKPMQDISEGRIGPLVTFQDLEAIMSKQDTDGEPPPSPAEKVAAWIQKCDDQQPQTDVAVKSILKALKDNSQDAINRRAAIREEKEEARNRFGEARRNNSDELLASLINLLKDDNPDLVAELNTKQWSSNQNAYTFRTDSIVRRLMSPVFRAPSKYSARKKLHQLADQLRLVSGEKKLMEKYIRQIIEHCGHPDTDAIVLRRNYRTDSFTYYFSNPAIRDILKQPLSKPRGLSYEQIQKLASQVKKIALRKGPGEKLLQELKQRLKDVPCVGDLNHRNWDSWSWSWMFKETYIQDILYGPISKPHDITVGRLGELENELRTAMAKKKLVQDHMERILAPIAKSYPAWYAKLRHWKWHSRTNLCSFRSFYARGVLRANDKLEHVEQMEDDKIEKLTSRILTGIEIHEASGFGLSMQGDA